MNKIIRKKNENYTIISNVCVRDNRLSLKAKGLMSLVMSLPDGWDFSIQGLSLIVKEGKAAIYAAINELKEFGYCKVVSNRNEKGIIIGNDYAFFEEPYTENPYTENPYTENPYTENQDMDNPDADNQSQINKEVKEVKTEIIKEKDSKEKESEFIDRMYKLYPTKCPIRDISTGKCSKDKKRIEGLLKRYSREDIENVIKKEVKDKLGKHPLKNFSTFLNNFPDPSDMFSTQNFAYPTSIDDVKDDDIVANIEHLKYVMFEKKFPKIFNSLKGLPNTCEEFDRMVKVTEGGIKGVSYAMLVLERDGWEEYDDPQGFMWIYANFIKANGLYKGQG